jgi:hypothetical protein
MAQISPKMAQDYPKIIPMGPTMGQDTPNMGQDSTKIPTEGYQMPLKISTKGARNNTDLPKASAKHSTAVVAFLSNEVAANPFHSDFQPQLLRDVIFPKDCLQLNTFSSCSIES